MGQRGMGEVQEDLFVSESLLEHWAFDSCLGDSFSHGFCGLYRFRGHDCDVGTENCVGIEACIYRMFESQRSLELEKLSRVCRALRN